MFEQVKRNVKLGSRLDNTLPFSLLRSNCTAVQFAIERKYTQLYSTVFGVEIHLEQSNSVNNDDSNADGVGLSL